MGKAARAKALTMGWEQTARRIADLYVALVGTSRVQAAGA